jgi:hypothetical protein
VQCVECFGEANVLQGVLRIRAATLLWNSCILQHKQSPKEGTALSSVSGAMVQQVCFELHCKLPMHKGRHLTLELV